jgi:hypothetical protein
MIFGLYIINYKLYINFTTRERVRADIAQSLCNYGLHDWSSSPGMVKNFLFSTYQTNSGAHAAYYPWATMSSFARVMRPGHEDDHSPPTSAESQSYLTTDGIISYRVQ